MACDFCKVPLTISTCPRCGNPEAHIAPKLRSADAKAVAATYAEPDRSPLPTTRERRLAKEFEQRDIDAGLVIDIAISHNGVFVWVNIDGKCALRIKNVMGDARIVIDDRRIAKPEDKPNVD